ncbi:MAG TPA: Gfo/Idh/MocA family oxidoreductase [Chloroflexota bacterium]|nr:Gfo/Idh/MocA family oxidoreductase [Chloroflexota bacterium]
MDVLRLGFAGLGEAATLVLPEIKQLPYIRVTAAADVRAPALERFESEFKGETFRTVEELCASRNVDAIYVATPHELHPEHTMLALESGKHVIVEKPMALCVADAEKMNQTAERCGVKLLCGHTKSFDPPIRKMRSLIREGRIGRLRMINTWNYNDFMVRPYPDREMEVSRGVVLNQGPHQVDIVRLLGGGMVRSVRAMTGTWDETRPEGAYSCYLEFEDGAPATIIFSSYGYFDTAELTWWLGEASYPGRNQDSRRAFNRIRGPGLERRLEELKEGVRYGERRPEGGPSAHGWGSSDFSHAKGHQRFYGLTIVSGDKGEMRQSQDGILLYGDESVEEIPVGEGLFGRQAEVTELYNAVVHGRHMFHDGRWGEATLEVCLGMLQSAAERKEIMMSHQVPVGD